jgi:hypothetical protein
VQSDILRLNRSLLIDFEESPSSVSSATHLRPSAYLLSPKSRSTDVLTDTLALRSGSSSSPQKPVKNRDVPSLHLNHLQTTGESSKARESAPRLPHLPLLPLLNTKHAAQHTLSTTSSAMNTKGNGKSAMARVARSPINLSSFANLNIFKRKKTADSPVADESPLSTTPSPSSALSFDTRSFGVPNNFFHESSSTETSPALKITHPAKDLLRVSRENVASDRGESSTSRSRMYSEMFIESYSPENSPISFREDRASRRFSYPDLPSLPKIRACDVCTDECPISEFDNPPTSNCKHVGKTCRVCVGSWIASSLESQGWESIRCPDCTESLSTSEIKQFASSEVFER